MATSTGRQRPFPALVIVSLLFLFCLYPGQAWMAHFFPRLAGLATIDPGLIILGAPFRLLFSIDLILVPILFLIIYIIIVFIYSISQHLPIGRSIFKRSAAVLSGAFFLVVCTSIGGLISYFLVDQLPARAQHTIAMFGINADIHIPLLGYATNSLHGNILSLVGFLVGLVLFISKVTRDPQYQRSTPLTRDQKMSPYQRMLEERRRPASPSVIPDNDAPYLPDNHVPYIPASPSVIPDNHVPYLPDHIDQTPATPRNTFLHCRNEPLQTLEPEAVNYRPLG